MVISAGSPAAGVAAGGAADGAPGVAGFGVGGAPSRVSMGGSFLPAVAPASQAALSMRGNRAAPRMVFAPGGSAPQRNSSRRAAGTSPPAPTELPSACAQGGLTGAPDGRRHT